MVTGLGFSFTEVDKALSIVVCSNFVFSELTEKCLTVACCIKLLVDAASLARSAMGVEDAAGTSMKGVSVLGLSTGTCSRMIVVILDPPMVDPNILLLTVPPALKIKIGRAHV